MLTETLASAVSTTEFPVTDTYASVTPSGDNLEGLANHGFPNAHILVTAAATEAYQGYAPSTETMDALIGRIVAVRPNRFRQSWYAADAPSHQTGIYLHGPMLNPTPVNGRHYRELQSSFTNGAAVYTLRYNDDDHREDRADPDNPWTIPAGGDPYVPNGTREVQRYEVPRMYVEIQWPAPPAGATDEEIDVILSDDEDDEEDESSEPTAAPLDGVPVTWDHPWESPAPVIPTIENAVDGYTKGLGMVEEDGTTLLDPSLEHGQAYLAWDTDRDYYLTRTPVGYWDGGDTITLVGYYSTRYGAMEWVDDSYQGELVHARSTVHWAKLAGQDHVEDPDVTEARVIEMLERRRDEFNKFEDLNDALNELADEQSWCGEYESNMGRIGMRARRGSTRLVFDPGVASVMVPQRHAYDIELTVDFSGEMEYINSAVESAIERAASFGGSISSLSFNATASFTLYGIVAESESEARSKISLSDVEGALDSNGTSYSEISDWAIESVNEDEDFEWDDYDG